MTTIVKKYSAIFLIILPLAAATLIVHSARAADTTPAPIQIVINPNLPGTTSSTTPGGWVASFYQFALLMAGILAFGAIVYGGFLYATAQGNPGREGEGKSWIAGALTGLLLLAGAYVILYTVNPNILSLSLPGLPDVTAPTAPAASPGSAGAGGGNVGGLALLNNCVPTTDNLGTAKNRSDSPGVKTVVSCINNGTKAAGTISATWNGQHTCNVSGPSVSCHFGGLSCNDGAHAFDLGGKALKAAGVSLSDAITIAQGCGNSTGNDVSCRCESFTTQVGCTDPSADHIHCNVNSAPCRCP